MTNVEIPNDESMTNDEFVQTAGDFEIAITWCDERKGILAAKVSVDIPVLSALDNDLRTASLRVDNFVTDQSYLPLWAARLRELGTSYGGKSTARP